MEEVTLMEQLLELSLEQLTTLQQIREFLLIVTIVIITTLIMVVIYKFMNYFI